MSSMDHKKLYKSLRFYSNLNNYFCRGAAKSLLLGCCKSKKPRTTAVEHSHFRYRYKNIIVTKIHAVMYLSNTSTYTVKCRHVAYFVNCIVSFLCGLHKLAFFCSYNGPIHLIPVKNLAQSVKGMVGPNHLMLR